MRISIKRFLKISFWTQILQTFLQTSRRFPLAIISLIAFTALALLKNHDTALLTDTQWGRAMLLAATGGLWFIAIRLFGESHRWQWLRQYAVALPVFGLIYWQIYSVDTFLASSAILLLSAALAVSFAAYLFRSSDNASIWYFNYQLVAAILFAVLSALILCGGVSLIVKSIEYLFETEVGYKVYSDIWVLGWSFFAPVYFLSNVPVQFDFPRSDCKFPRGVHFIQNYVLVPLSLIYMVILYAYFVKILLQWELPRGNLGTMISTFGVVGVFTHLTIYPVYDRDAPLLEWFYRHFYKMMAVPLGLLVLAITVRISEYGLTEPRYLVVICTIWFALLILYYSLKGLTFQIKSVVVSLAVLLLLASVGPWRIDKLPIHDQFERLRVLLVKENMLVDNKYIQPVTQPSFETRKSLSSMVEYLASKKGIELMRPWFNDQAAYEKVVDCNGRNCQYSKPSDLVKFMGITYVERWQHSGEKGPFFINLESDDRYGEKVYRQPVSIKGFDSLVSLVAYKKNCKDDCSKQKVDAPLSNQHDGISIHLMDANELKIILANGRELSFDLSIVIRRYEEQWNVQVPQEDMHKLMLNQSVKGFKARLYIHHMGGEVKENVKLVRNINGILLISTSD